MGENSQDGGANGSFAAVAAGTLPSPDDSSYPPDPPFFGE